MRPFHRRVTAHCLPAGRAVLAVVVVSAGLVTACANKTNPAPAAAPAPSAPPAPAAPVELVVQVVNTYPHDRAAFTQGLLYAGGKLYESTGLVGQSSLRRVDLESGRVEKQLAIEPPIFAEGLALAGDELIQISWQNGRAFVYRSATFEPLRQHEYGGEGWGLAYDGHRLIMSDGSAHLTFRDPKTFVVTGGIAVVRGGLPVSKLNELEWADGQLYANVWETDVIVRIDAGSGAVTAVIDASGLLSATDRVGANVLNGIAALPERGTFLITGKFWPRMFEVRFVPR